MTVQAVYNGNIIKERTSSFMNDEIFNMLYADVFIYGGKEYVRKGENVLDGDVTIIEVDVVEPREGI